ncbi:MAG: hypothetical protein GYB65_08425 [Chloroflexi bacterium]|nr:hypothetical protein [Chloroflexota bacterium]
MVEPVSDVPLFVMRVSSHKLSSPLLFSLLRFAGVLVRLLVLVAVMRPLHPAPPRVVLGPPHTVETVHPVVCAHTRLTDEVEEWKIQRTLSLVREMGAGTIVEFFPWPYAESERGTYDWAHFDRIMRHAENQGLDVIARLGMVPGWARPPAEEKITNANYLPDEHFETFAQYVAAFVGRYGDQVDAIIIWNEPNLSGEWGERAVDPEAYTWLLRMSYEAAHAVDPDVVVMGGALAPTTDAEAGSLNMSDIEFLERMYAAEAAGYFDVLAVHTYGHVSAPQDAPDPAVTNFRRIELLREIMHRNGDDDKPVVITEGGWLDDPRSTIGVRPGQRITYTLAAFEMVEGWPWAEHLCIWNFRLPLDLRSRRDAYYALVSSDFYIKPIYYAIQAFAREWENPYQLWTIAEPSAAD